MTPMKANASVEAAAMLSIGRAESFQCLFVAYNKKKPEERVCREGLDSRRREPINRRKKGLWKKTSNLKLRDVTSMWSFSEVTEIYHVVVPSFASTGDRIE